MRYVCEATIEQAVDAASARAAAETFLKTTNHSPSTVFVEGNRFEQWDVVGFCETCGMAILHTDDYCPCEDGVVLCKRCEPKDVFDGWFNELCDLIWAQIGVSALSLQSLRKRNNGCNYWKGKCL